MPSVKKRSGNAEAENEALTYIREITNREGHIFRRVLEEDVGIDAHIELCCHRDEPSGFVVALQVKSGESYIHAETDSTFAFYPTVEDLQYWWSFVLPVYLVVYRPRQGTAYWLDVKEACAGGRFEDMLSEVTPRKLVFQKPNVFSETFFQHTLCAGDLEQQRLHNDFPAAGFADDTAVRSETLEREYMRSLRERVQRLQSERSFINPWPKSATLAGSDTLAAPQSAAQMRRSGEVDPGLPSLRFSMQAKKLSVEELRKKYGGAELNYDDYVALVTASGDPEINDVVGHICDMQPGWAIQVLGAPGIGKSFLLRLACLSFVAEYDTSKVVPFYLELRDAPHEGFGSPDEVLSFVARSVSECMGWTQDASTEFTEGILGQGRGVVFFDAIDEAADPLASLRPITEFTRTSGRDANRYVFSCRTFDQVPGLVAEELVLLPLSYQSLREYLRAALVNSPLRQQVDKQLHNAHLRRVLGTPLVASAYARFVRDRDRLPKTLYEALTDGLHKRFWAVAVQDCLLSPSATDEEFDRLYAPAAQVLRRLAYKMRNRMTPVTPPKAWRSTRPSPDDQSPTPDPLTWGQRAGVLYSTADGRIAFGLHRYKELYLAEKWTKAYESSGTWPQDVTDRIGRIMWAESLLLLGDLVKDQESFLRFLYTFCEDLYRDIQYVGLVESYRLVEALVLTARMAASRCTNEDRRTLYKSVLLLVHRMSFDDRLPPPARSRIVRSLGAHANASSADVLFAIYDDATFVQDKFLRSSLQESALAGCAELITNDVLGDDRIDEFVRRAGRRALRRDVSAILSESSKAPEINQRIEQEVRKTHVKQAIWTVFVLLVVVTGVVVARSYGVLGLWVMSIIILVPCTAALWTLRVWRGRISRSRRRRSSEEAPPLLELSTPEPEGELYAPLSQGSLPYSAERYWIPKDGVRMVWLPTAMPGWTIAAYRTYVASLFAFVITLVLTVGQLVLLYLLSIRRIAQIVGAFLKYAPFVLPLAVALVLVIYRIRSKAARRARAEAKKQRERDWQERLRRVREESERLRADDVDVDYIVDHLMEDVPFGPAGVGVVQARVEAIRRHMVSDATVVERLEAYLQDTTDTDIKALVWSVIDDMARLHVMKEEKELFGGAESSGAGA